MRMRIPMPITIPMAVYLSFMGTCSHVIYVRLGFLYETVATCRSTMCFVPSHHHSFPSSKEKCSSIALQWVLFLLFSLQSRIIEHATHNTKAPINYCTGFGAFTGPLLVWVRLLGFYSFNSFLSVSH